MYNFSAPAQQQGFHLIEVIILLSILMIVSQQLVGNYQHHIAARYRQQATTTLYNLGSKLGTYGLEKMSFEGATLARLKQEQFIANNRYQLSIRSLTKSTYVIVATPQQKQLNSDIACGTLGLTSNGDKFVTGHAPIANCW